MESVFISAYSAMTPLGNTAADIARGLRSGIPALVPMPFRGFEGTHTYGSIAFDFAAERERLENDDHHFARIVSDSGLVAVRVIERLWSENAIEIGALDLDRVACIGGAAHDSPLESWKSFERRPERGDMFHTNKYMPSATSALMGKRFGIKGPVFNTAMACAGSGSVLLTAWSLLQVGRADAAVIFAVNVRQEVQLIVNAMMRFGGMSHSGKMAYASRNRDGFCVGDVGVAIFLETESHLRRRGATPRFLIRATEVNNDGHDCFVPTVEGMSRLYRRIQREVGTVDYVNPHGAATKTGDPVELTTIRNHFGDRPWVNSTKAYVGHSLEACFLQEMVHTMVQMENGFVAPIPHTTDVADECRGTNLVLGAAVEARLQRAICHNLGLGGVNAAACIERANG
jgi:3-oxoacyl-(acyl-carrier-protein) synthase